MGLLNKPLITGLLLATVITVVNAAHAATTEIKADIVDGICQVSFSNSSIIFTTKNSQQFAGGTAEVLPLDVNMRCEGTSGLTPSLKVTGESAGVSDQNLFRSTSSTAAYAAFMLKKGTVTDTNGFYSAPNTVAPGDIIALTSDEGSSVEHFTVGLVQAAGDPPLGNGTVSASINFAFVFP